MLLKIYHLVLQMILPSRCISCDKTLQDDAGLCLQCWNKIHFITGNICIKCGYPLEFDLSDGKNNMTCGKCFVVKNNFDMARSICSYNSIVGKFIGKLKYGDNLHIAKFIAKSLLPLFILYYKDCDIICPVPMHKKRLQKRTFNHAALITVILVKMLNKKGIKIIYIPDLLKKTKLTATQNQLNKKQRIENVKGSFDINLKYSINNKKILILDDVITTGSTINECAKMLKKNSKNSKIYAISFARTTLIDFL